MNGEIINLENCFDSMTCEYYWSATITFKKKPEFKLGIVEVKQ